MVLEGAARGGVDEGVADGVRVLYALGSGDDMLIAVATDAAGQVTLVSADRALRQRAEALGAGVASPGWPHRPTRQVMSNNQGRTPVVVDMPHFAGCGRVIVDGWVLTHRELSPTGT